MTNLTLAQTADYERMEREAQELSDRAQALGLYETDVTYGGPMIYDGGIRHAMDNVMRDKEGPWVENFDAAAQHLRGRLDAVESGAYQPQTMRHGYGIRG